MATNFEILQGQNAQILDDITPPEMKRGLVVLPRELLDKLRDAAAGIQNAKVLENRGKTAKTAASTAFITALKEAEELGGVTSIPFTDPVDNQPKFAYVRRDEILTVDAGDLRESLIEYYRVIKEEDDDLAVIHAGDIMEQVLKPPAIDNEVFRRLVDEGKIDNQVAASASTLTAKAPFVAFEKPKPHS